MKSRLVLALIAFVVVLVNAPFEISATEHWFYPGVATQSYPWMYAVLVTVFCGIASVLIVRKSKMY